MAYMAQAIVPQWKTVSLMPPAAASATRLSGTGKPSSPGMRPLARAACLASKKAATAALTSALRNGLPPLQSLAKWIMGSDIEKNSMPAPVPQPNSIENQAKLLNSGRSSSRPSRILPTREHIT